MADPGGEPESGHTLTWRQRKVLRAIRESILSRGYPPSMREIADEVGLVSIASVRHQLDVLERAGYLKRDLGRPRSIELRLPAQVPPLAAGHGRPAGPPVLVPVVSRIEPGLPVLDAEQIEDVWPLPRKVTGDGALFIVMVPDEAMTGAAVAMWDWVVVRQQDNANDDDIVVATLGGATAVRTFRRHGGHAWLVPHHPDYQPVLADDATILGVVTAVLRLV